MADQAMLKSILKWSLKQQPRKREGAGETEDEVKPMSEERRKWLGEALGQIVMDETRRINDIVKMLEYDGDKDVVEEPSAKDRDGEKTPSIEDTLRRASAKELTEMKEKGLEELVDRLCQIDNAKYFALNHGGTGKLPLLIGIMMNAAEPASMRWRAADAFATVVQNNPEPQARALKLDVIQLIMKVMMADDSKTTTNGKVRTKLFYALTCTIRSESPRRAIEEYVKTGGVALLSKLIRRDDEPKLCKKALFFAQWLFVNQPQIVKLFATDDILARLVTLAGQNNDVDMSEKALHVLVLLAGNSTSCAQMLKAGLTKEIDRVIANLRALKADDDEAYATERLKLAVDVAISLRRRSASS